MARDLHPTDGARYLLELDGELDDGHRARYRVAINNYLASGGDNLVGFTAGTDVTDTGIIDLDALVAWIARGQTPPTANRIRFAR